MGKYSFPLFLQAINDIYWIFPLTLDNIQIEPDLVNFHKTQNTHKTNFRGFLMLLIWDVMNSLLLLWGINRLKNTRIQPISHYIRELFLLFQKKESMETFRKSQNEVIGCFNQNNWLVVDASKVGHSYSKMYVDTFFLVMLSYEQVESIETLNQKIHNAYKRH